MVRLLFLLLLGAWLAWWYWPEHVVVREPGKLWADLPPQQQETPPKAWQQGDYEISSIAKFKLRARVLAHTRYYIDRESDLAPFDVVFGWEHMSESSVLDKLSIKQEARWYNFSYKDAPPIPVEQIVYESANMHMIPGNANVLRWLKRINVGDIVTISGYLVRARGSDGWTWTSSLSRTDTGSGACELVWVDDIDVE